MKLRAALFTALGCLALFVASNQTQAQTVVAPNAFANVAGDSNNGYPFNISQFGISSMRYQQVYASTQFSALTEPNYITAIAFRLAFEEDAFNSTLTNVQINLSTTPAIPNGLSTTFADNVGANNTVVYSGALTLSSANIGGPPPDFDIVITLQTPFFYDPALGNLLLDVRNFDGGFTAQFDAVGNSGVMSRIYANSSGVNSPTADNGDELGLITQFSFAAIPEPTTWALIGVVTLGTGVYGWNKRRRNIKKSYNRRK